ncbi:MAG: L,D-transpeptidase [Bacilli bacterium]|nr:L,D-transpeptidase [Bacilli bacterium]
MKKQFKTIIIIFLVLLMGTYVNVEAKTKTLTGIVLNNNVDVKSDTSKSSKKIYTLSQGTNVKVKETSGSYYILEGKGQVGYVKKSSIALTYILVDISDQKLYVYNDGVKKWSANVVTGTKGVNDTPKGHYTLKRSNFKKDTYLMGNSHVDYWMPFITSRGIGFHDASWRSSSNFKKSTYLKHGSHGCVNMKTKDAKKLYETAPSSVDVIVRQ